MELSAFFLFALIASITPGPSNVLLTTIGAQKGIIRGIPTLVGVALGTGLIVFIVGFGLGASALENKTLLSLLNIVGMGAIFWLAWGIATSPVSTDLEHKSSGVNFGFLPALLLQWVNPKAWIVSVSIVGAFMTSQASAFEQAAILSSVFIIVAVIGCTPWLASGAAMRTLLQNPKIARLFNLLLGFSLAASVISLL